MKSSYCWSMYFRWNRLPALAVGIINWIISLLGSKLRVYVIGLSWLHENLAFMYTNWICVLERASRRHVFWDKLNVIVSWNLLSFVAVTWQKVGRIQEYKYFFQSIVSFKNTAILASTITFCFLLRPFRKTNHFTVANITRLILYTWPWHQARVLLNDLNRNTFTQYISTVSLLARECALCRFYRAPL